MLDQKTDSWDATAEVAPIEGPITKLAPASRRVSVVELAGLTAVIAVAASLRFWKLDQNGYGNPYYGACVRSMLASFNNFFFASFDPAGIVTVDKPPVALWFQAISAKLLGYTGFAVLMPQALMGVASVVLTYHLVRRAFGATAGLVAGLALAVTPICVAVDRDNLPDPALVLCLLLAAWALIKATEKGSLKLLLASVALVGVGFNIKMLAAFVVLPTFYLVYLVLAPVTKKLRLAHLTAATVVLAVASMSWPIVVELTPKSRRPYIGGSRTNSALELALGYNGIARIMGMGGRGPGGMGPPPGVTKAAGKAETTKAVEIPPPPPFPGGGPPGFGPGGPGGRGGMPMFGGTPGIARFANAGISGLITWLFPVAILGSVVAAIRIVRDRPIVGVEAATLLLWAGWAGTHWVVFSFARGIFHEYYTVVLGPAVAAMAAIGFVALRDESSRGGWRTILLPASLLLTAAWEGSIFNHYPTWRTPLIAILGTGVGLGSAGWVASRWVGPRWSGVFAGLALASLMVGPATWSAMPVVVKGISMMPNADPTMMGVTRVPADTSPFGRMGGPPGMEMDPAETKAMIHFLTANRHGEPILIAGMSSMSVSSIIIETGETAVGLGGFMGADPAVTKDQFIQMVKDGRVRFVISTPGPGGGGPPGFGPPGGGGPPGMGGNGELMAWVREHGKVVDAKLWKPTKKAETPKPDADEPGPMSMFRRMMGGTKLYDCRPELGLVESPK